MEYKILYENIIKELPSVEIFKTYSEVDYYGIREYIAKKINKPTRKKSFNYWKHGWYFYPEVFSLSVFKSQFSHGMNYLVTNDREKKALNSFGVNNVIVAGLPFIYIDEKKPKRIKNSLLYMPTHTLDYIGNENFEEKKFFKRIISFKKEYDFLCVCFYYTDYYKNLNLIKELEKHNIYSFIGAYTNDRNSLLRVYKLLSYFETVGSNGFGSHILYSNYMGCNTFVDEEFYIEITENDLKGDVFYKINPELKKYVLFNNKKSVLKKRFPFLFVESKKSVNNKNWADNEIGIKHKKSYRYIYNILEKDGCIKGYLNNFFYGLKNPKEFYRLIKSKILKLEGLWN